MSRRLLVLLLLLAGCGQPTAQLPGANAQPTALAQLGGLAVTEAYVRPAVKIEVAATMTDMPGMAAPNNSVAGAYLTITNSGDSADTLLGITTAAADRAELHETVLSGTQSRMEPRPAGLAIPAHGQLRVAPGSYHVMLVGLAQSLTTGMTVDMTLRFAQAGTLQLTVPVQAGP